MVAAMIGQTLHLYDVVTRDRERLMEEQRRLEKNAPRPSARDQEHSLVGIVGASQAIRAVFSRSTSWLERTRPCCCAASPALARSCSPAPLTIFLHARMGRSSDSIARRFREHARDRIVRSREGFFYRRPRPAQRKVRTRRPGNAVPRRNWRYFRRLSGQASAGVAGGRIRAGRR